MFAIGDREWAGISKLIEECGEVVQVAGKLIGTGGEVGHWDGTDLKDRLEEEIGDLLAAVAFVTESSGLDSDKIEKRMDEKIETFIRWHLGESNEEGS